MGAERVVVWDPMACCGDLGFPVVTQPGALRDALAAAGPSGPVRVVYQPRGGDLSTHWENMAWLCLKRGNLILMADEVDGICSAGSPLVARSPYYKTTARQAALDVIVNYGRHHRLAFIGIARTPQDVWRSLTGQSLRMLCFKMDEEVQLAALRGRLGSNTERLKTLGKYEYLDWRDTGEVEVGGGVNKK